MNNYKVYIHINKVNNKTYIGITNRDLNIRWGKDGKGYKDQPKFYNAIKKYGWDNFEHKILQDNLTEEEALKLETKYILEYNSIEQGYNILLNGIKTYPRNKKVYCLTTNTLYPSINDAAQAISSNPSSIIQNCKGKVGPVKGTEWTYWDSEMEKPVNKNFFVESDRGMKTIYCIEERKFYKGIKKTSRLLNIDPSGLQAALSGRRNGIKGLHFIYLEQMNEIPKILKKKTGNYVLIYCLETQQVFRSLKEASEFCGKSPQSIIKNCQGKTQTCGQFHFKYVKDLSDELILKIFSPKGELEEE